MSLSDGWTEGLGPLYPGRLHSTGAFLRPSCRKRQGESTKSYLQNQLKPETAKELGDCSSRNRRSAFVSRQREEGEHKVVSHDTHMNLPHKEMRRHWASETAKWARVLATKSFH